MRKLVSILLLMSISTGGFSLGLGNIELSSGLNQTFDARIELLSPTSSELDSLNIRVADIEAFDRAGIEWLLILNTLSFEVEINEAGPDYIKISSREAIREPFLNFLLEASWSSGRLFREYTVLLDPPFYDPGERQITVPTVSLSDTTPESSISSSASQISASSTQSSSISSSTGNEYGPVTSNDTLWAIANQVRPDSSISVQQMMLALLRANPEAFIAGNINGLRQGQVLRVPDQNEIINTSLDEALADVRSQNAMWEDVRGSFAGNAVQRPIGSSTQPSSDVSSSTVTSDSELRLVAPSNQSTDVGQSNATFDTTGQGNADNILANEQLEALSSENNDLRSRLDESEVLIQDLRRLLELQDDELATIQQQVVGGEDQTEDLIMSVEDQIVIDEAITSLNLTNTLPRLSTISEPIETEIPPAMSTTQTETMATDASLVDQILRFVFGNMMLVGGAIGAIILSVLGFMFIRKRKGESADGDETVAVTDFPDFEFTDEATDMPESSSEMDVEADVVDENDADKNALLGEVESDQVSNEIVDTPEVEAAAVEEPEDDPLAEVNVFLAYEHFDQAEEFVRDAISNSPENLDFHSKLLEVFYSSGDKVKYEEEARVVNDLVSGEGPHWEMAQIMWQEISPNRVLFAEPTDGEADEGDASEAKGGGIVDLTADDDAGGIELDLGTESGNDDGLEISLDGADDDAGGIELDLGAESGDDDGLEISLDDADDDAGGIELDLGTESGDDDGLEISLDGADDDAGEIDLDLGTESDDDNGLEISLDEGGDDGIDLDMEIESEPSGDDISLDLSIEEDASVPEIEIDSTTNILNEISFDLDEVNDDDDEDHTVFVPRTSDASEQSVEDEVATKLDLAKAYVELGDNDSASTILDEIIADGNDAQRQQAEKLKSQLS